MRRFAAMTAAATNEVLRSIGDYELLVKIGEGGMGTVYKARCRSSGQVVALKLVPSDVVADTILIKRFEKEFLTAKTLDHPNIVRALDYQAMQDEAILTMEFVDGISLGEKLEREGRLPEAAAILIVAQVAQALHHAHQRGLIHRDVKPDNVLLTPEGQAKLADLGLVKEMEASQGLTNTGRALGTPHFMAPEQFRSAKSANVRSDVFSLGATLYIMVTGELPFQAKGPLAVFTKMVKNDLIRPRKLNPALSEHVERVICKALNANPLVRPASCREFLGEVLGAESGMAEARSDETDLDLWYVEYEDERGTKQMAVGPTKNLRRSLQQGLLGDPHKAKIGRYCFGPAKVPLMDSEFKEHVVDRERPGLTEQQASATTTSAVPEAKTGRDSSHSSGCMVSCTPDGAEPRSDSRTLLDKLAWPLFFALAFAGGVLLSLFIF
jgi:serine/threonine protein kinase